MAPGKWNLAGLSIQAGTEHAISIPSNISFEIDAHFRPAR